MRPSFAQHLLITGFCLTLLLPVSAAETPPTSARPTTQEAQKETFTLRFAPVQGARRVIRMNVVQTGTHVGAKVKSVFRQVVGLDTEYEVLPETPDARIRLRSTIHAARYQRDVDGKVVARYDSAMKTPTTDENSEIFSLLVNFTFVIQMQADGTMGEIEDKDNIAEQMMDKLKVSAESQKYVRPAIVASLEGTAFKNIGNIFASFPHAKVALGAAWPKRDVVSVESNLIYDGTLTLARRESGLSTLHVKSSTKPNPALAKGSTVQPLAGTQTGYYLVEDGTGWTKRAHLEQRWTGQVDEMGQFVAPSAKGSRPLYMKMVLDIKTLDTKAAGSAP